MSLQGAVKKIALEMENEAASIKKTFAGQGELQVIAFALHSYAKQLLGALEASADSLPPFTDRESEWKRQAREEFSKKKLQREETTATTMVQILDGPLLGDFIEILSSMPLGACCAVSGFTYKRVQEGLVLASPNENTRSLTGDS